jgi:hypothetical protein
MLNRKYIDGIFLVLGIFLAILLIRFGQGLAELWRYGLIYSAILLIFIAYLAHARRAELPGRRDTREDKQQGKENSIYIVKRSFFVSGFFPTLPVVFLLSTLFIVLFLPTPFEFISDYDWSHQLAGANQILRG